MVKKKSFARSFVDELGQDMDDNWSKIKGFVAKPIIVTAGITGGVVLATVLNGQSWIVSLAIILGIYSFGEAFIERRRLEEIDELNKKIEELEGYE